MTKKNFFFLKDLLTPYTTTHRNAIASGDQQQLREGSSRRHLTSLTNYYSRAKYEAEQKGKKRAEQERIGAISGEGQRWRFRSPCAVRCWLALCRRHEFLFRLRKANYVPETADQSCWSSCAIPAIASLPKKLPGHQSTTDCNRRLAISVPPKTTPGKNCQGAKALIQFGARFHNSGSHFGAESNVPLLLSTVPARVSVGEAPYVLLVELLQLLDLVYVKRITTENRDLWHFRSPCAVRCHHFVNCREFLFRLRNVQETADNTSRWSSCAIPAIASLPKKLPGHQSPTLIDSLNFF
ncbi:hypothetical protein niasHS_001997 [Heterodera schachtii]|uniref:Uncharacterized protein n=1 Tax=Heterodera schachtii TaxID=97005 RepID=A0ABD2K5J0_HETSC